MMTSPKGILLGIWCTTHLFAYILMKNSIFYCFLFREKEAFSKWIRWPMAPWCQWYFFYIKTVIAKTHILHIIRIRIITNHGMSSTFYYGVLHLPNKSSIWGTICTFMFMFFVHYSTFMRFSSSAKKNHNDLFFEFKSWFHLCLDFNIEEHHLLQESFCIYVVAKTVIYIRWIKQKFYHFE